MATLILSTVGTLVGGPLGGAIGALIGQQIDSSLFTRKVQGPRLKELSVQTSSYGSPLPLHFGTIRSSGSVIWATELVEHKEKSGGGKGRPSVTSYTYTASFAVALASRPIAGVGRIWADGNLLRGEAGDLKVGGQMRIHTGFGDQPADPLLAQAEGIAQNPAYRNLAYVVFEDLALADYGNRLPSLTFEIIADDGSVSIRDIVGDILPEAKVDELAPVSFAGFTLDQGSVGDVLSTLSDVTPISCNIHDDTFAFSLAEDLPAGTLPLLPPPVAGGDSAEDARATGWSRRRDSLPSARQCALRYYDVARDYQPGLQRSIGRSGPGDVNVIELPAAMTSSEAREHANRAAWRLTIAQDSLRYRISEIDPAFVPGAIVRNPVVDGSWRIDQWEWQADGVMLDLSLVQARTAGALESDPGRSNRAPDLLATPTIMTAFEIPWDGTGDGTSAACRVAASGASNGWTGASLYSRQADGTMIPAGATGRQRAIVGAAVNVLPAASPLLLDRCNFVDVHLASSDFVLSDATWAQLMQGTNLAALGSELIQFARAIRLDTNTWRLSHLMRGRGGTEATISGHASGEAFALVDERLVQLDASLVPVASTTDIVAIGLGDATPAVSAIANPGLTLRPLSPVHGSVLRKADGSIALSWVRRARGSWAWLDDVEVPLNEATESWEISFTSPGSAARTWRTSSATLELEPAIGLTLPAGTFEVRQVGRQSRSLPLTVSLTAS